MGARGAPDQLNPLERLRRGSVSSRRRLAAGASVAVLVLAGIAIALAWTQYDDAKHRAVKDLQARVAAVAGIVDVSFSGQIATLDAIAESPAVMAGDAARMHAYFAQLDPTATTAFTGGLGWIDRKGVVRASNRKGRTPASSAAQRLYFRRVIATRSPYISAGLISRRGRQPLIVVAVPTFDRTGSTSGVLAAGILLKPQGESRQALDLGYGNLQVIDRNGRLLVGGSLAPVANKALLGRMRKLRSGAIAGHGLDGHGDQVVAFSTSSVPGWITAIDRPSSTVFAAARRSFALELGSVLAAVILVLTILVYVNRRARREADGQDARARSWSELTGALASTTTPDEVADTVLDSLASAFPNAVAVIGRSDGGRLEVKASSQLERARLIVESTQTLEQIAMLGLDGPRTVALDRDPALRSLYTGSRRRLRAVHSLPIPGPAGEQAGTISLLSMAPTLEPSEWALLRSFSELTKSALERTRLFVHEHELAVQLQRSLLPELLPSTEGLELTGHYLAGGDAVEVGGDWYEAIRRPDGIVHLCAGDVSGKGIGAATVMSRQRQAFGIFAQDSVSPAEIIRRMLRHADGDELITVACVTLDPYEGTLTYSSAGHPPPLLLDRGTGVLIRLDRAVAPPLGVALPPDVIEERLPLPASAVVVIYTDGLVERRGGNIDDGIDLLARIVAENPGAASDAILAQVGAAIGAPTDDVALLIAAVDSERTAFDLEIPADPAALGRMRSRLYSWLADRALDHEEVADVVLAVSEACNNAIEHAYRDNGAGTVSVGVRVEHGTLEAVVEDGGKWQEPVASDERGRGILLMHRLMHSADIDTGLYGSRVSLSRRLRVADRAPAGSVTSGS